MKICIDPGHFPSVNGVYMMRGKQSPEVPPGIYEGDFNIDVADHVSWLLRQAGHDVVQTVERGVAKNVTLARRREIAQDFGANILVSIHANAAGAGGWNAARGFIAYHNSRGESLAVDIAANYTKSIGEIPPRRGGVELRTDLAVLKLKIPSVLIECGFMTNLEESALLATDYMKERISVSIMQGISRWIERVS